MRRSALKLYAPFIALALAQAAFVVAAPSKGEQSAASAYANGALPGTAGTPAAGGSTFSGGSTATGATSSDGAVSSGGTTSSGGGSSAGGGSGDAVVGGGDSGGGGGTVAAAGDTSHCKGDRQTDVVYNAPPCVPKFAGDNGGATYQGVTDKEVKFIMMQCQ